MHFRVSIPGDIIGLKIIKIDIYELPSKTVYILGQSKQLDLTNGKIKMTSVDGSSSILSMNDDGFEIIQSINFNKEGKYEVEIKRSEELSCYFTISVTKPISGNNPEIKKESKLIKLQYRNIKKIDNNRINAVEYKIIESENVYIPVYVIHEFLNESFNSFNFINPSYPEIKTFVNITFKNFLAMKYSLRGVGQINVDNSNYPELKSISDGFGIITETVLPEVEKGSSCFLTPYYFDKFKNATEWTLARFQNYKKYKIQIRPCEVVFSSINSSYRIAKYNGNKYKYIYIWAPLNKISSYDSLMGVLYKDSNSKLYY